MTRQLVVSILLLMSAAAILHAQGGRPRLVLEEGKSGAVWDIALSLDGSVLYSGGRDSTVKAWRTSTGECLRTFRPDSAAPVTCIALHPDGSLLAAGDVHGRILLWESRTGKFRLALRVQPAQLLDLHWTIDGTALVSVGRDDSVRVWDMPAGTRRAAWKGAQLWQHAAVLHTGASSTDTTSSPARVWLAGQDGSIVQSDLAGGGRIVVGRHSRFARTLCTMHEGGRVRYVCSGGRDGRVKVWDTRSNALFREFHLAQGYAHALLPLGDGSRLLVGKMNGLAEVWDWRRGRLVEELSPASYGIMASVADTTAGRLYTAHTSGAIRVWNLNDRSLLLDMVGFSDGQWLSFTPDGYFDCSAFGGRYVYWEVDASSFPLSSYETAYRRSDILEAVLAGTRTPSAEAGRLLPAPEVRMLYPRDGQLFSFGSESLEVVVEFEVRDTLGVGSTALYLNGRVMDEHAVLERTVLVDATDTRRERWRIEVRPGRNTIHVLAWNTARVRSVAAQAGISVETATQVNPSLFVLAVGSDRYAPHFPDLRYGALDAESIAAELSRQEGGMYERVYATVLVNEEADREGVSRSLAAFPPMTRNDVLLLFFSGHGVRTTGTDGREQYFYVSPGMPPDEVAERAISWSALAGQLQSLKAGQVVLLLDACHSGDVAAGVSNEKVATQLRGDIGMIFTSSSGNEFSFEDPALGHGVFTAALLEALQGKADVSGDGTVDWNELQLYVTRRVRALTQGGQNPSVPFLEQFANFDVVRIP